MLKGEVKRKQPFKYISDSDKSCLLTNFEKRGWIEGSPSDYNFYWSNVGNFHKLIVDHTARLQDTQIINHFPNHLELTRKDLMVKNIKRYRKDWEKSNPDLKFPEFLPLTFILPSDYNLFSQEFKKNPTNNGLWIMKPTDKARGIGIFIISKLNQIKKWSRNRLDPSFTTRDSYVVSKYIENPFLLAGKKFDLRLYVLLASWRPLIVYKYAQGFARFCSVQYSTDTSELDNNFMHLTNVSIQSKGEDYNDDHGGKWSFTNLLNFIAGTRGKAAVDKLKKDIDNVLSISIRSVASMMTHEKNCFELYGFDLLVDSGLQPWLIEVNASPSLSATTAADKNLKHDLINDMLNIIVPSSFPDVQTRAFPKNRKEMGGFEILIE